MGWLTAAALAVLLAAHLTLVVGLARRHAGWRAAVAFVVTPLAPWWGYGAGLRVATIAWCAALALYVLGVVLG
jgi:hypothetical protein